MPVDTGATPERLTRREALKRGALFGGALLWTTPAVQAIGMSRALAAEPSGCTTYCIKYEFSGPDDSVAGSWTSLGSGVGNVLMCPAGASNGSYPGDGLPDFEVKLGLFADRKEGVVVVFPESCELLNPDSTPDPLLVANVAAKCGSDGSNPQNLTVDPITREIEIEGCGNGRAISHIELIVRCCG